MWIYLLSHVFSSFVSAKGLWVQQSVAARKGKGEEDATQTILRECRKYKKSRGHESQFSEDLQALLFGHLCLAALQKSKIKVKDPKISITGVTLSFWSVMVRSSLSSLTLNLKISSDPSEAAVWCQRAEQTPTPCYCGRSTCSWRAVGILVNTHLWKGTTRHKHMPQDCSLCVWFSTTVCQQHVKQDLKCMC